MIFDTGMDVPVIQLCKIDEAKSAVDPVLLQYSVHSKLMAARYFDIIYKNAAFSRYKCAVDIISVIGDQLYALFIIQVAVIFRIGLVAVDLGC